MSKDTRRYNKKGPDYERYEYSTRTEQQFVKNSIRALIIKIVQKRKEKNLSQEALAEITGISISSIRFIENFQRTPSLPVLMKIIYALDKRGKIW